VLGLLDAMAIGIVNISQVNMKGLIRDVKKEEVTWLLKTVMEDNI